MSSIFDHGAQFFTKCFKYFLITEKIIRPWGIKLAYYEENSLN